MCVWSEYILYFIFTDLLHSVTLLILQLKLACHFFCCCHWKTLILTAKAALFVHKTNMFPQFVCNFTQDVNWKQMQNLKTIAISQQQVWCIRFCQCVVLMLEVENILAVLVHITQLSQYQREFVWEMPSSYISHTQMSHHCRCPTSVGGVKVFVDLMMILITVKPP